MADDHWVDGAVGQILQSGKETSDRRARLGHDQHPSGRPSDDRGGGGGGGGGIASILFSLVAFIAYLAFWGAVGFLWVIWQIAKAILSKGR